MPSGMNPDETDAQLAREALREVMQDATAPAAARAAAARTMLELAGALGRHAPPPPDSRRGTAEMSREALEAELALGAVDPGTE